MSLEKNIEMNKLLDIYLPLLNANQGRVMLEYYQQDKTLSEIATNQGVSRQAVLDAIKKCESKLLLFEKKLNLNTKKEALVYLIADYKNARITKDKFIEQIDALVREI